MNKLCPDIGFHSLIKKNEELCGDHVEMVEGIDGSTTVVLADGLGSGVKANILATLTAKIISTMIANGLNITDCVETIVQTLPVCAVRGIAYSTFTIFRMYDNNTKAEIIQYDNPKTILLRNNEPVEMDITTLNIDGKTILTTKIDLQEHDMFILMSDGCIHAGVGTSLNFGWDRKEIIEYMHPLCHVGFSAKTFTTILLDQCNKLYNGKPGDDTTACTIKIKKRQPVNLIIGPPFMKEDCVKMMSSFFKLDGRHIVCGGTTSNIAAEFLKQTVKPCIDFPDPEIPPIATINGVDLVTEGIITISKVLSYAKDYLNNNTLQDKWMNGRDGASLIAQLLFEVGTDINFFVGRAVNPAHQNPSLPVNFNIKMQLISDLESCLKKMGKTVTARYF